ncbi:MAG: SulP family inorganic anion transporter [Pirellulales bacterium]
MHAEKIQPLRINVGDEPQSRAQTLLSRDLPASLIVFLVALPLCMGIAVASGVPVANAAAAGIVTGIIGGIVVGAIAGSPLQVSGPAAGLTVLVAGIIQQHGFGMLGTIVLAAGAIQLTAGLLRMGGWFRAVSPAVIQGMLSGIGILILASQFHVMVDDSPRENGIQNLLSIPESVWKGLVPMDGTAHHLAAAIGVGTIVLLLLWQYIAPGRLKLLPGPVVAVTAAAAITYFAGLPIQKINVPDSIASSLVFPNWETLQQLGNREIIIAALTIALIASAESLLCAAAVDKMHTGPRTKYDRELSAQGIGNMLCGALGALPMTGVIVRSSANVRAGGVSRASAILHGVWLLLFVVALPGLLRTIPLATLAAVLVYTGYKLIDFKAIRWLFSVSRSEGLICVITLALVVGVDLLTGVIAGIVLAALRLLYGFSHLKIDCQPDPQHGRTVLHLQGAATFLCLPKLSAVLDKVPATTELHVHLEELTYVDHACFEMFINWEKQHEASGGKLVIDWDNFTAMFHSCENGTKSRRVRKLQKVS